MSEPREILEPLKEPVSIKKALLAGREARLTAAVGGEHAAFLVNIQLTSWNNTKEFTEGFVEGFNRAAAWMQSAVLEHLAGDARDAARYRWLRDHACWGAGIPAIYRYWPDDAEERLTGKEADREIDEARERESKA